jgi:hypothetical protein
VAPTEQQLPGAINVTDGGDNDSSASNSNSPSAVTPPPPAPAIDAPATSSYLCPSAIPSSSSRGSQEPESALEVWLVGGLWKRRGTSGGSPDTPAKAPAGRKQDNVKGMTISTKASTAGALTCAAAGVGAVGGTIKPKQDAISSETFFEFSSWSLACLC